MKRHFLFLDQFVQNLYITEMDDEKMIMNNSVIHYKVLNT